MGGICENLQQVRERVQRAADKAGRNPDEVLVVAVSKMFDAAAVLEAAAAGQRVFGENRVQEAEVKITALHARSDLEWHLVGHLQSNKSRRAAELFHMVHSVDSSKAASRLSDTCIQLGIQMPVLVQVDLAREATKFGVVPESLPEFLDSLAAMKGIAVDGLMTIPPYFDKPDDVRPYFARLRVLREASTARAQGALGKGHLSMGMSHDFEAAILEGATIVRIGTAIFGERSSP